MTEPKPAVLISIRPEWCFFIRNGLKTMEVRKSRPKLEFPFKVYIYQTRLKAPDGFTVLENGVVIGDFLCSTIKEFRPKEHFNAAKVCLDLFDKACLTAENVWHYSNNGQRILYGWHISDLRIYENPLNVSAFHDLCGESVKRAPQSWMYVERQD